VDEPAEELWSGVSGVWLGTKHYELVVFSPGVLSGVHGLVIALLMEGGFKALPRNQKRTRPLCTCGGITTFSYDACPGGISLL